MVGEIIYLKTPLNVLNRYNYLERVILLTRLIKEEFLLFLGKR